MRTNNLIVAQADNLYDSYKTDYTFLINSEVDDLIYDKYNQEWYLDGVGHSDFRLELVYDKT